MSNRVIACCLTASFIILFIAEYTGLADALYSAGALGSAIFSLLAIQKLNRQNRKSLFPYLHILILVVFWVAAFMEDSETLSSLSIVYLIFGLWAVVSLLQRNKGSTTLNENEQNPVESQKSITLDQIQKTGIIVGALVASLSIAYYLVVFLPGKEEARTEQQKQEQIAEALKVQESQDQSKKEYVAKRKNDCYGIFSKERIAYDNADSVEYDEIRDVCVVIYSSNDSPRSEEECSKILENLGSAVDERDQQLILRANTNCVNNTASQDF